MGRMRGCPPEELLRALLRGDAPEEDWRVIRDHVRGCDRCREALPRVRREVDHDRRWHHTWRRLGLSCPEDSTLERWRDNQRSLNSWEHTLIRGHLEAARCGICLERLRRTAPTGRLSPPTDTIIMRTQQQPMDEEPAPRDTDLDPAYEDVLSAWRKWAKAQVDDVWRLEFQKFGSPIDRSGHGEGVLRLLEAAGNVMSRRHRNGANSWLALGSALEVDILLHGEWIRDRVVAGIRHERGWGARPDDEVRLTIEIATGTQRARARIRGLLERPARVNPCLVAVLWHEAFLAGRQASDRREEPRNRADLARWLVATETHGGSVAKKIEGRAIAVVRRIVDHGRGSPEDTSLVLQRCRAAVRRILDEHRAGDALVNRWAEHVLDRLGLPFEPVRSTPDDRPLRFALRATREPDPRELLSLLVLDVDVHRNLKKLEDVIDALRPVLPTELEEHLEPRLVETVRRHHGASRYLDFRERSNEKVRG